MEKDNDTLTHFFWPTFNLPLQSPLDHYITSLKRIKKRWSNGNWSNGLKVDQKK